MTCLHLEKAERQVVNSHDKRASDSDVEFLYAEVLCSSHRTSRGCCSPGAPGITRRWTGWCRWFAPNCGGSRIARCAANVQTTSSRQTALVNEAYLRLVKSDRVRWQNRAHFFAISAQLMRRILVDAARERGSIKRGGKAVYLSLDEAPVVAPERDASLLALDEALSALAAVDPRKSQVVELRYFGGLSVEETADALGLSAQTIMRDWKMVSEARTRTPHSWASRPRSMANRLSLPESAAYPQGSSDDTMFEAAAVSPSGRQVATAFTYGQGDKALRVWNVETGDVRRFELPPSQLRTSGNARTGYEQGITRLSFAGESTLYSTGDGGVRRWNLTTGSHEVIVEAPPGYRAIGALRGEKRVALAVERRIGTNTCRRVMILDLAAGTSSEVTRFGDCPTALALDPSGTIAATGSVDGIVRVGRLSGGEPHLLIGHKGTIDSVAISPDLRWVATTGGDNTLRLWPMPDLSKPPLHTLPREELIAKLQSLTNLRVVRDASASNGWKVEVGPFPGWKNAPTW